MAYREYIGSRYVPIFGRKGETTTEWDNLAPYEPLTVVTHEGNSFISRQYVPTGINITNKNYWIETGNYNAQVEAYRQEVRSFDGRITENSNAIAGFSAELEQFEESINSNIDDFEETTNNKINDISNRTNFRDTILESYFGSFNYETPAESENIIYMQGACLKNETYYQFTSQANKQNAAIFIADLVTGSVTNRDLPSELIHVNDATYNNDIDKIVAVSPKINDTNYYINIYNQNTNVLESSYNAPNNVTAIAWDTVEKCYWAFYSLGIPFSGVVLLKLDNNFQVLSSKNISFGSDYFSNVKGFGIQSCECDESFIYLGYSKQQPAILDSPLQGSGIFVLDKNGNYIAQIMATHEHELESVVKYKDHFLISYNIRRISSGHNPLIVLQSYIKPPMIASSQMFICGGVFEGIYPRRVDIYIDRTAQNFFSDGTQEHPLKHVNELNALNNRWPEYVIHVSGEHRGCGLALVSFENLEIDGGNNANTIIHGVIRYDRCGNMAIRNVTYQPSTNTLLNMGNTGIAVNHCNAISFNNIQFDEVDNGKQNVVQMYATVYWITNCLKDANGARTRYVYASNCSGALSGGDLEPTNFVRTGSSALNGSFA